MKQHNLSRKSDSAPFDRIDDALRRVAHSLTRYQPLKLAGRVITDFYRSGRDREAWIGNEVIG